MSVVLRNTAAIVMDMMRSTEKCHTHASVILPPSQCPTQTMSCECDKKSKCSFLSPNLPTPLASDSVLSTSHTSTDDLIGTCRSGGEVHN